MCSAKYAYAVSSGMTALDVILRQVKAGEEIIAGNDIYGGILGNLHNETYVLSLSLSPLGTNRLLKYLENQDIKTHHVDTCVISSVEAAMSDRTRVVLLETPTNPLIKIADLRGIASMVHARNPNSMSDLASFLSVLKKKKNNCSPGRG